jgi:hypothetical protein
MIKLSVKVIDRVNNKLNRLSKQVMSDVTDSVEDATRFATFKWKELMPKGTGKSAGRIYSIINKKDNEVTGLVVSPAFVKPNGFFLNLFLERASAPGKTTTKIKDKKGYRLRSGFFGAAELTKKETENYFKVLVETKVDTTIGLIK